jgi:hypothetical protein
MSIVLEQHEPASRPAGPTAVAPLLRMLDVVRRQTRRWIWIESLAAVAVLSAAVFWGTLAFDWAVEPPAWLRGAILAASACGILWLVGRRLVGRLATPLGDEPLALVVERAHPEFRDSLSTAIGLAAGRRSDIDPELLARTTAEATLLLDGVDPRKIFRHRRLSVLALAAAAAVGTVGLLAAFRPGVAALWMRRSVLLADEPWPRRVGLEVEGFVNGVRKVARGGDVDVIVHARGVGGPPDVVELRSRGLGGWRTERMGTRGGTTADTQTFGHVLKGVAEDMRLEIRGGDARLRNLRLHVVEPPALESLAIRGTPPDYLGTGVREPPAARIVSLPRGSRVEVSCVVTKPLASATLSVRPAGTTAGEGETVLAEIPPAAASSLRTIGGIIAALDGDSVVTLRLVDTDGLANREPIAFTLSAVPDEVPRLALRLRGISTAVTPRARLPLAGTISDDHALSDAAARLAIKNGAGKRPAGQASAPVAGSDEAVVRTLPLAAVRGGEPLVELGSDRPEVVSLEPLGLQPGVRLQVTVTARDRCTLDAGPQAGTSDAWTLDVVRPEELLAMLEAREIVLRRRYEAAIDDLAQARERHAAGRPTEADADPQAAAARLGEAAARATGETAEIAEAFHGIRLELDNNLLLTPELETRVVAQIADPLAAIAAQDLPAVTKACRDAAVTRAAVIQRVDVALAKMRAVLARMMELESFNEVIERLRGVIRTQEEIRAETIERQKKRAREALERP